MSGHSAGGHLTAMCLLTDWPKSAPGVPRDVIKAAVPISGLYDLEPIRLCYLNADLKLDPSGAARNSPLLGAPASKVPVLIAVGGAETDEFRRQSSGLAAAWKSQGIGLQHREFAGHNHFTIAEALADAHAPMGEALLEWIGKV